MGTNPKESADPSASQNYTFSPPQPPPPQEITATHHTTRQEVAQPGLAGRVQPKFTATLTKFITERVKPKESATPSASQNYTFSPPLPSPICPPLPLAKALAKAQGGEGDSAPGGVVPGGVVCPLPPPAPAAGGSLGLVPPPASLQMLESTWCPSATVRAPGFIKVGDTLPPKCNPKCKPKLHVLPTPAQPQILPLAKAQGPVQSLSMVEEKVEDREREIEQVKGAATPGSGPGLGGAAPTGKQEKQELQSEITGNEKLREDKRVRVDLTC